MAQQLSINTDAVGMAVNTISQCVADIQTRTEGFIREIEEANTATEGKWPLLVTLQERLNEETKNITSIIDAQEEIKKSLNKYIEMAEEASSDNVFGL